MTAFVVRPATPADAPGIAAIYDVAVRETIATFEEEPPGPARWLDRLASPARPGDHLLVAVDGGRVLGYAGSSDFRPRRGYRFTREVCVYVAADARRRGMASAMYAALVAACRADGIRVLVGVVAQPNEDSNALHERLGFEAIGQLSDVGFTFDRWLGLRFYQRVLAAPAAAVEHAAAPVLAAGQALVDLAAQVPADSWDAPGLGSWDVRALVGHAGRGLTTLAEYAAQPTSEPAEIADASAYYAAARRLADTAGLNETVRARGVEAGVALGADPPTTLRTWLAAARAALAEVEGDPVVPTALGRMRLSTYLPTRVVELTVHTLDLAVALGVPPAVPAESLAATAAVAAQVGVALGRGPELLLGLTGRRPLPGGFSVVP